MPQGSAQETTARLSPRELEVAKMVAQGLTNREIAAKLFISERTVDGHLEHIREKLGVNTRAQVSAWVVRLEAAPPAPPAARPGSTAARQRWTFAHPTAWLAGALVLGLLAAGVGVLRLTEAPAPVIEAFVGGQCARERDPGGCFEAETQGARDAKLSRPTSIAVDSKGRLYIADYGNYRIRRVAGGIISTVVGGGDQELTDGVLGLSVSSKLLGFASTVAVDSHDQLYILTSRNDVPEVWSMDANGFMHIVVRLAAAPGTYGAGAPNLPVGGLAISREGVIFICDREGNKVMKFEGGALSVYAGGGDAALGDGGDAKSAQLSWPIGLALDKQENLFIADTGDHRIRRVDHAKGTISTVAGGATEFEGDSGDDGLATAARLSFPFAVVVAPNGTMVIADTGNNRLREISAGRISALAGTGRRGLAGDGFAAVQAELDGPEALALDAKGNLYIADTENQRIRKIPLLFGSRS